MKVAVSASGPSLEAEVDPRFGRCPYFILIDVVTGDWDAVENSSTDAASGAGIQAAQTVASHGAEAVITGDAGPNAYRALSAGGIALFTAASGTVQEALEQWRTEALTAATEATVAAHTGAVTAPGPGPSSVVAVATEGDHVAGHFGRCEVYTVAQVESGALKSQSRLTSPGHSPGFLPGYLAEHGVQCVIAGGMGPRAVNLFAEKGIDVMIGVQGPIDRVLHDYAEGALVGDPAASACSQPPGHTCEAHS
jgi:predicted Fe-Mo cluster-binding NifX family protein